KKIEKMPKYTANDTTSALVNGRSRKKDSSSIGERDRSSASTKTTAAAKATAKSASTHDVVKPFVSPSMIAKVTEPSAAAPSTSPGTSRRAGCGSALSGT